MSNLYDLCVCMPNVCSYELIVMNLPRCSFVPELSTPPTQFLLVVFPSALLKSDHVICNWLYKVQCRIMTKILITHNSVNDDSQVHSVEQKSIGVIFCTFCSGSDVRYSCHHNSSRSSFPLFAHSWCFSVFHLLQSITLHIY